MASVHATSLGQLWHEVITVEPLPPRLLVLGPAVAALILVGWRRAWPLSRTLVTIAHEGGHALVALAVGRRLDGVRVHRSTAGLTVSAGSSSGPGIVATAAAPASRSPRATSRVRESWPPPRRATSPLRWSGWGRRPCWPPGIWWP